MPKRNDHYTVTLKKTHLDWGRHRYTTTREPIAGEGYVPIHKREARQFDIQRGYLCTATFSDGFPSFSARAAGNSRKGDPLAKQFQGDGDLKAFGRWFAHCGAEVDDMVSVTFTDEHTVNFELIKH